MIRAEHKNCDAASTAGEAKLPHPVEAVSRSRFFCTSRFFSTPFLLISIDVSAPLRALQLLVLGDTGEGRRQAPLSELPLRRADLVMGNWEIDEI